MNIVSKSWTILEDSFVIANFYNKDIAMEAYHQLVLREIEQGE